MGVADRDWSGSDPPVATHRRISPGVLLLIAAIVLAAALTVSTAFRSFARDQYDRASGTAGQEPLYAADDTWAAWLAPESVCPGGEAVAATPTAEVTTMLC